MGEFFSRGETGLAAPFFTSKTLSLMLSLENPHCPTHVLTDLRLLSSQRNCLMYVEDAPQM